MKLMILDGNSIMNRSFYGIRPLNSRDGLFTHAVFGFLTTLLRLNNEEAPDALCAAFDVHAPTFRHQADASYKSTRKPMPQELRAQMPLIKEVLDALHIPRYELSGWEADDLLGTVSRKCEAAGWECVIATGDRDCLQLLTQHTKVKLISTRAGRSLTEDFTPERFREQYGFDPPRLIDLKALMGDPSDHIPGVPGIGEKTASALIRTYGTLDALYQKLPDIDAKPGLIRKLSDGESSARHSFWLASIDTNAPLSFRPEDNLRTPPGDNAYPLFVKLDFNKLIDRFGLKPSVRDTNRSPIRDTDDSSVPPETESSSGVPAIVELTTPDAVQTLSESIRASAETLFVRADNAADTLILYRAKNHTAYALDRSRYQGDFHAASRILLAPEIPKAGHNLKDLQSALLSHGIESGGWVFDSALAAYLLDATAGPYNLDRLCIRYGGFPLGQASGTEETQLSLSDMNPANPDARPEKGDPGTEKENPGTRYANLTAEAAAIAVLRGILEAKLKEQHLRELFESAELPLCAVLAEMEQNGCLVDRDALRAFGAMLSDKIAQRETQVHTLAGETFNLNSPKQLGEILFGKLALPHGKKTKTGWSTNADVLDNLRDQPIVSAVLEYRQYAKLKSTYADGLLKAIAPDGRVHTSFQMTATATGRLSSAEPNLQNIPTRTDLGSEIRRMFIPGPGRVFVDADYSQIELRILAHMSGDTAMIRAFAEGRDIHTATAAQVFHTSAVTPEMRRSAKAVNFGIVYGISAFSLSQDIGVSVAEAKAFMESYFAAFPGVRRYMDAVIEEAKERGYVETLFHRRRELPELKSSKFSVRSFGERVALNMPVQGTAADIMKFAMGKVWRRLKTECPQARLVLQIHDELIAECPEADREQVARILREEMESVTLPEIARNTVTDEPSGNPPDAECLRVPLTAQAHWGHNWLEAKG